MAKMRSCRSVILRSSANGVASLLRWGFPIQALAEEHAKASERVCMALPEWWQSGVEPPCVE